MPDLEVKEATFNALSDSNKQLLKKKFTITFLKGYCKDCGAKDNQEHYKYCSKQVKRGKRNG